MSPSKIKQPTAKPQKISSEEIKRKIEYFSRQLDLAHKRNDLADHLRFNVLQTFFGFHSLIIGAIVAGDKFKINIPSQLTTLLPIFVFSIGFSLFIMFFRYHIYLYGYKKWIENIEIRLQKLIFSEEGSNELDGYTGTYSLDNDKKVNTPKVKFEEVVIFSLFVMAILNIGVTLSLSNPLYLTPDMYLCWSLLGFMLHIVAILLLLIRNSKIG